MNLSQVQKEIGALRDIPDLDVRRSRAHALIPSLSEALGSTPIDDSTQVRLWIQLARWGTGRPVAIRRVHTLTPGQARRIAEDALTAVDPIGDIRAARKAKDVADEALRLATAEWHSATLQAVRAGVTVEHAAEAAGVSRPTVYDWLNTPTTPEETPDEAR